MLQRPWLSLPRPKRQVIQRGGSLLPGYNMTASFKGNSLYTPFIRGEDGQKMATLPVCALSSRLSPTPLPTYLESSPRLGTPHPFQL